MWNTAFKESEVIWAVKADYQTIFLKSLFHRFYFFLFLNTLFYLMDLQIGKLLLKSPELSLKDLDNNNVSPFHFAVLQNNFELVELFLKNSPDLINMRDKKSARTPLVYAIQLASIEKKMSEKQVAVIK